MAISTLSFSLQLAPVSVPSTLMATMGLEPADGNSVIVTFSRFSEHFLTYKTLIPKVSLAGAVTSKCSIGIRCTSGSAPCAEAFLQKNQKQLIRHKIRITLSYGCFCGATLLAP